MIYLITLLYTLADVMYAKYQFIDGRRGPWHAWRLVRVIIFFAALFCYPYFPFHWWDALLCAVINATLFDIGINVIALHVGALYTGTTSVIDRNFKNAKWYAYAVGLVAATILKITHIKKQQS